MSRSGYSEDGDYIALYRGSVVSSIRGKRGRALLLELAEAMDAMPVKELIADQLQAEGRYCALGVVGAKRGVNLTEVDPHDAEQVSQTFDIAECLAREIVWINDDEWAYGDKEKPEHRWQRVRKWVQQVLDDPRSAA